MKNLILLLLLSMLAGSAALAANTQADLSGLQTLAIGDAAPDFSLPGIDGKVHTLADYQDSKVLVIAFMSNHCPDSQAAESRVKKLVTDFGPQGMTLVAINPNNPEGLHEGELGFSKYNDSQEEMVLHAKERGFNFPYLYDGATQATAKAYGCLATPHLFIFDAARKLRYKGQLDDSRFADPATIKASPGHDAVAALLANRPVPIAETKPHGCSTKWIEKKASVTQELVTWEKKPVDIELIDTAGVATLRRNGTRKLRLFNVWATWCGPCVEEFPELVKTSRHVMLRDFELITISLDDPSTIGKAKAFLEKQHAALPNRVKKSLDAEGRTTNSYLYNGTSQDELIQALDPEWPGPIPHSILVSPDGQILWRHNGPIDGEALRVKILEVLGNYYLP